MAIQLKVRVANLRTSLGGPEEVREYLQNLRTRRVMFVNGPESPGPCVRCLSYHRTVWQVAQRHPTPPLHPNCYCSLVSYRDTEERKPKQKGEELQKALRKMRPGPKKALLGKGIEKLHRLGIVETTDLVSSSGGIRTLEQLLKSKLGISPKQYGRLTTKEIIEIFERRKEI